MSGINNQRQRSKAGAKILKSSKDLELGERRRLDKQLAKAADIEAQLGAFANKKTSGDDNKSYKLRSHLCEVLSDILITNPKMSLEKDCFQRLWRGCFYNPIRIWRQRVSREKRKRSPSLAATQEGFQHFLSEAVTLYDYLVLQYLTKLVPCTTQQSMTQQSRDTISTSHDRSQLEDTQYASQFTANDSLPSDTVASASASSLKEVVHGLYKLYIFLGDLHRYAEAYNKAEASYLNASKLGPGLGNPYNQLAVVAFSKDAYCIALYWYARSLLATHEKFSTSSNNLERLFASNREFLLEHGRNSTPAIFLHNTNNNCISKNKNSILRAQKVAATKSCLTYFVDLHYDLYQHHENIREQHNTTNDCKSNNDCEAKRLRGKMKNVIASLKSLIQASGFGDSLLCKIVVINSFSLERASNVASMDSSKLAISKCMAKEFFFSLGLVLAEHVERLLVKSLEKATPNKPAPSVRCLLPFEILLDFVSMRLEEDRRNENNFSTYDEVTKSIEIEFWKRVSTVGNLVRKLLKYHKMNITGNSGVINLEVSSSAISEYSFRNNKYFTQTKEYQLLKGYRPFSIVNEEYLLNKDGFLNAVEVVDVLELSTTQSASQDTSAVSAISEDRGSVGVQENTAKLLRVLEICEHLALSTSVAPLMFENGDYLYKENSSFLTCKSTLMNGGVDEEESSHEGENLADYSDDEAGDIIVFQGTKDIANNQARLSSNPSSVTAQYSPVASAEYKVEEEVIDRDVTMTVVEEESPRLVSTSAIKPPPGFGEPSTIPSTSGPTTSELVHKETLIDHHLTSICGNPTIDLPGLPSPPKNRNILDQVIQGRVPAADLSSSSFHLPQQQDHSIIQIPGISPDSTRTEMFYPFESGRSNLPTSVEESIRIFGDMKTTNPFVVNPPASAFAAPINNQIVNEDRNQNTSIFPDYVAEGNFMTDDTKWLNSNLLNSLWMGETSKTKNPWAGK